MAAKQTPHVMGRLVEHQAEINCLSTEDAQWVGQNPAAALALLVRAVQRRDRKNEVAALLGSVTAHVDAVEGTRTSRCFMGSIWAERGEYLDRWLAKWQEAKASATVTVLTPSKDVTCIEVARTILGVGTYNVKEISNQLISGGHTLALRQAQALAERTEDGEATGLDVRGYLNFFFVKTGDARNPVLVGNVCRKGARDWRASIMQFDSLCEYGADYHFLICNVDALRL